MSGPSFDPRGERLVDCRAAAQQLNLPLYWLINAHERKRRGVPHYRVHRLVRFKVSELVRWMQRHANEGQHHA